ncbi:MAG: glutaredoxin family protein [Patescibacteria group bacterium]
MANITIYTTPTCVYCKMAKEFFAKNNTPYTEKDVMADDAAREEMIKKSGQLGVPVIDIDGTIVVGFDRQHLADVLGIK